MKNQEPTKDQELQSEGWSQKFTTSEPRLSEAVDLYRSLGFDVHLEPLPERADDGECRSCMEHDIDRYRTIYTRKIKKEDSDEEDLFG